MIELTILFRLTFRLHGYINGLRTNAPRLTHANDFMVTFSQVGYFILGGCVGIRHGLEMYRTDRCQDIDLV